MKYSKDLEVLTASVFFGFILMFPQSLLRHELVPSLMSQLQKQAEKQGVKPGSMTFTPAKAKAQVYKPKKEAPKPGQLRIEGIIFDTSGDSTVIINGAILKEGDPIEDFTVKQIKASEIILTKASGAVYSLSEKGGLKVIKEAPAPAVPETAVPVSGTELSSRETLPPSEEASS